MTIEPAWLSEQIGVLPEDRVRLDPEVRKQLAGRVERSDQGDLQDLRLAGIRV